MRRSDRAIEKEEALHILENGEFGVLSTVEYTISSISNANHFYQ